MDLEPKPILVVSCALRPRAEIGFVRSKSRGSRRVVISKLPKSVGKRDLPTSYDQRRQSADFMILKITARNFRIFQKAGRNPPRRRLGVRRRSARATEPHSAEFRRDAEHKIAPAGLRRPGQRPLEKRADREIGVPGGGGLETTRGADLGWNRAIGPCRRRSSSPAGAEFTLSIRRPAATIGGFKFWGVSAEIVRAGAPGPMGVGPAAF